MYLYALLGRFGQFVDELSFGYGIGLDYYSSVFAPGSLGFNKSYEASAAISALAVIREKSVYVPAVFSL